MSKIEAQVWESPGFKIERATGDAQGTVFRFFGPFTARDMYSTLAPDAFRDIFESAPGEDQPAVYIFDLTEVPYMDSLGLGTLIRQYVRCQSKGIRLTITGISPRVQELFRLTKVDSVLPIDWIRSQKG